MILRFGNMASLHIASNLVHHEHVKYRSVISPNSRKGHRERIQLEYICTEEQVADFLTKVVTKKQLSMFFSSQA